MTTPVSPKNGPLVLDRPLIPRGTTLVAGADYGIPLHIYDLEPMGLLITVQAYLEQAAGDTIRINLNGQVDITNAQTQSNSSNTTLYLPKKMLRDGVLNQMTYTVERSSHNIGTSAPPLTMLYNAIRPGNQDTDPGVDGHSRLELLLPDAIKNGVGPDFVGAQVCVSYPYCRAGDEIRLNCNGHDVDHTVTESEAPLPASDIPVTVCFPVTRADLAHGDSSSFKLSFTVTDKLSNTPDTDSPWSATTEVDVDLAGQRLPGLILREKLDDPSDDPGIIDPEKLGTNPLLMIALTSDPGFQPRDVINATYTAKIDGEPDIVVTVSGTVETDDFGQKSPCILQVANGQVVGGSTVTAWYELFRGSVRIGRSRIATARVLGGGLSDLKPPRFQKSVNGVLDPLDPANQSGANGQVELLGHRPGDTVQLIVEGSPGPGSPVFNPLPLNASSRANFPLSSAFIAANMGKQVTFSYLLFRNGKQYTSQTLTASVSKIPENHPDWPVLSIDGANHVDNSLDIIALNDSTRTRVSAWPHISEFQRIWLRYFGTNDNGTPFEHTTYSGDLLPAGGIVDGLLPEAPVTNLRKLKWSSNLRVEFKVTFDGSLDESTAQTLVRTYEVWSSVIEEDFPVTLFSLRAGESFQHDHMKFECVRGYLSLGSVYSGPNEHVDGHGVGAFQLYDALPYKVYFNDMCSRISFWYYSNSLHAGDVKFFDVSGNFLGTCPLVNRYQLVNHQITFEAQGIKRMDINVGSPSGGYQFYFDSFTLNVQR